MATMLSALDREVRVGGSTEYVIKRNGGLEQITFESDQAVIPDEEMYRCLEFYGVGTETYEITFTAEGGEKTATKLPILLRIIDEQDGQHRDVFQVSINFDSVGPKSSFGQMVAAILGAPFVGSINDEFWASVIGGKFGAALSMKTNDNGRTYVNLVYGSAKPFKAKAKTTAKPKDTEEEDPFNENE